MRDYIILTYVNKQHLPKEIEIDHDRVLLIVTYPKGKDGKRRFIANVYRAINQRNQLREIFEKVLEQLVTHKFNRDTDEFLLVGDLEYKLQIVEEGQFMVVKQVASFSTEDTVAIHELFKRTGVILQPESKHSGIPDLDYTYANFPTTQSVCQQRIFPDTLHHKGTITTVEPAVDKKCRIFEDENIYLSCKPREKHKNAIKVNGYWYRYDNAQNTWCFACNKKVGKNKNCTCDEEKLTERKEVEKKLKAENRCFAFQSEQAYYLYKVKKILVTYTLDK